MGGSTARLVQQVLTGKEVNSSVLSYGCSKAKIHPREAWGSQMAAEMGLKNSRVDCPAAGGTCKGPCPPPPRHTQLSATVCGVTLFCTVFPPSYLPHQEYTSLSFSSDGKTLLAQGGAPEWSLSLWAWEKSKVLASIRTTNPQGAPIFQVSRCGEGKDYTQFWGGGCEGTWAGTDVWEFHGCNRAIIVTNGG